eukprot:CAMPEP_0206146480 /NCGR_PEP_ID=MMETSP1473-20131121/30435_1 /ASSEMBLY_ACC=CAM_ASM_001109 /TAXON_ID=1461547 /ORGANISM="Stichococcus sp, Strain RCC1054" /LENGTH=67 /DNA_ID=CAMNT_0053543043 /DNA_START=118 /DNA_END=317 /DNA_ORIENTATION=+
MTRIMTKQLFGSCNACPMDISCASDTLGQASASVPNRCGVRDGSQDCDKDGKKGRGRGTLGGTGRRG